MNIEVNYIAVLVAGIASMVAGAIWYILFGKTLMKIRTLTPEENKQLQKDMKKMFGIGFILSLIMAEVISHIIALSEKVYQNDPVTTGLIVGFWLWFGIAMPVQANHILFGNYGDFGKKLKLFGINTGNQLLSLLVMGVVLGWMK